MGILVLLGVAILLRLWNLGGESAWLDEVLSLRALGAPTLTAYFETMAELDTAPAIVPVYFASQYFWAQLFDTGLHAQRALSLVFAFASLPLAWRIGRRVGGRKVGLIVLGLLSVSLPHIFYSHEVRRYAMESFFALVSYYSLLRWLEARGSAAGGWLALQALSHVVLMGSSMFTAVIPMCQAMALLVPPRVDTRRLVVWGTVQGVLLLGLLVWLSRFSTEKLHWMMPPTWRDLLNTLVVFAGGRISNEAPGAYYGPGFSLDLPLAVLVYGLALWGTWKVAQDRRVAGAHWRGLVLLWGWFLGPMAAAAALSYVWKPLFLFRYFLFGTFGLYILAAVGLVRMPRRVARACAAVLILLFAYQATLRFEATFRPDYRAAAVYMATVADDRPILILKPFLNGVPFRYLEAFPEERLHDALGMGDLHEKAVALVEEQEQCWILLWRWDRMEELEAHVQDAGMTSRRIEFGGIPPLYVLEVKR